jgi:hypothetical protein
MTVSPIGASLELNSFGIAALLDQDQKQPA